MPLSADEVQHELKRLKMQVQFKKLALKSAVEALKDAEYVLKQFIRENS